MPNIKLVVLLLVSVGFLFLMIMRNEKEIAPTTEEDVSVEEMLLEL